MTPISLDELFVIIGSKEAEIYLLKKQLAAAIAKIGELEKPKQAP